MALNIHELYVINRALDGMDIYGVESFALLGESEMMVEDVKRSLVEQGMLESRESFTPTGVQLAKQMLDYKRAKKYLRVNNIVIAAVDEHMGILLEHNRFHDDYRFYAVDVTNCFEEMLESYPVLLEQNKIVQLEQRDISWQELKGTFELNLDNCLSLATVCRDREHEKKTKDLFFHVDGQTYQYDCIKQELYTKSID